MTRIYSNERTDMAYDGTPEAKVSDGHDTIGTPSSHPDAPARGLPEGHPVGLSSVLKYGVNEISDNEHALLARDVNFQRHLKAGVMTFIDDEGRAIDPPEAPEYVPAASVVPPGLAVVNQGAETLPDERTDAHAAQTGDAKNPTTGRGGKPKPGEKLPAAAVLTDEQRKDLEDFYGLNEADRAAMYPALTPEVKAAVDADPRAKAAV